MENTLEYTGIISNEELNKCPGCPSQERIKKGPVAIIECNQEIPCNPCEDACPFGAIKVGEPITNLPILDEEKCKGCGLCIASCPGLAIFVIDYTYSEKEASVSFPFEYLPLPKVGEIVSAVNREGKVVTMGKVIKRINSKKNDRTSIVTISIPKKWLMDVRGILIPQKNLKTTIRSKRS